MSNESNPYEIGKYYLAPCVQASDTPPPSLFAGEWIPVLLPEHDDTEIIEFEWWHYHLDIRFLSHSMFRRLIARFRRPQSYRYSSCTNAPSPVQLMMSYALVRNASLKPHAEELTAHRGVIKYRRLKCKRLPPPFPVCAAPWFPRLEDHYAQSVMKNFICPHRGIDLKTCEIKEGMVECPGHGLRWNVTTGALIKYEQPQAIDRAPDRDHPHAAL